VSKPEIIICRDLDELNRKAAAQFVALANEALARSGRFTVALSGGSTPKGLYLLLAEPEFRDRVDWPRVHIFWGDERCVPPDHPDSNYRMAQETLLARVQIPSENIHRMRGEIEPETGAQAYEAELRGVFGFAEGDWPRFDLNHLGLGEDGHTASLFPGSAVLGESARCVAAAYVEKLRAHRLTLTLPVINRAAQVTFLVSGHSKAGVVRRILRGSGVDDLPAARIRPASGALTWMITQDAAAGLME
jgi:6-phosphogluconolactonase